MLQNRGQRHFFKYFNFFCDSLNALLGLFGRSPALQGLDLILPLGISFYTFHTMSYTIDVYRRKHEPVQVGFWDYFLFVSFFPQLVAGPIARVTDLLPQFFVRRYLELQRTATGLWLIGFGLMMKLLVADTLGGYVDYAFRMPAMNGVVAWTSVLSFGYQIYVDFWSYTLIARGSSKLFGFELNENFQQPYLAASPSEFWQRWHMSLSTWFRDYLYIPLGGNRSHVYRNIFITMAVAGLWHGASVLFVLWGLYHAVLNVVFRQLRLPRLVAVPLTFVSVQLGWIFFRSQSLEQAMRIFRSLFDFGPTDPILAAPIWLSLTAIAFTMLVDLAYRRFAKSRVSVPASGYLKLSAASLCVMAALYLGESGATPFIYFNF